MLAIRRSAGQATIRIWNVAPSERYWHVCHAASAERRTLLSRDDRSLKGPRMRSEAFPAGNKRAPGDRGPFHSRSFTP
jgi:hypothetical protein